jgi:hypothetical protein
MRPKIVVDHSEESGEISKEFIYTIARVASTAARFLPPNYEISLYIYDDTDVRSVITFESSDKDKLEEYVAELIEHIGELVFEENTHMVLGSYNIDGEYDSPCAKVTMNYNFVSAKPL